MTQTLVSSGLLPCLVFVLPVLTAGSLLPTWMFINSLQIISHLVLLRTLMPVNAHYFLSTWNDWIRWYDNNVWDSASMVVDFKEYDLDYGSYNSMLQMSNYKHLIGHNLIIIISVLALLVVVWFVLALKDLIVKAQKKSDTRTRKKKPSTPWCTNFILRFFYVFFLEICLCAFLQLSVVDFNDVSTTAQFWIAVTFTLIISALVIFVSSLLFCKGPQAAGFYTKGSVAKSINEVRPRDPNFDSQEYLNSHPREKRNTPLLSKMVLFFNCAGVKKAQLQEQSSD